MVFQKRSNFGFNGFQIPAMPRGFRSARGRRFVRRTAEENKMYAFELLATVAGKLLQEDETFKSPLVKDVVQLNEVKQKRFEKEPCDQGSCDEGTFTSKYSKPHAKEFSQESTPVVLNKMSPRKESKVESSLEFCQVKKKGGNRSNVDLYTKPSLLASSGSSVEVPLYRNHVFRSSVPKFRNDMELLHHDDENSSGSTEPSTITSKTFLASKFWKVGPTLLMDVDSYSNDSGKKSMFRSRKMCCKRQRTQRSSFKRGKLISRSPMSSGVGINSETLASFTSHGEKSLSDGNLSGENDNWPSVTGQKLSYKSEDYGVKFRVKSLKVPELIIELPETATVGSLKRTVLETVTAMLDNGLRVGVIFQGKKVRDDSKTLQQAGICHGDELGSLGFKLEPKTPQATKQQLSYDGKSHHSPGPESPQPLARIQPFPTQDSTLAIMNFPDESRGEVLNTPVDHPSQRDDSNSHFSPTHTIFNPSSDKSLLTSKQLVAVPISSADNEMLAVVPSSKRRELAQRRIRRPFSVSEVEALVKAVEDLGTGRWRDVKIRAFEDAKHRTYVDLKDKWKTLVHTARISPHQRRGEPVPQELLDRVLGAHAYWSHQQAKAQAKPVKPLQLTQLVMEVYATDSFTDIVNPVEQ